MHQRIELIEELVSDLYCKRMVLTDVLVSQFVHEIDFTIELIQHLFRHVLHLQHLHCDFLLAILMKKC
jgi:hypothetical protein